MCFLTAPSKCYVRLRHESCPIEETKSMHRRREGQWRWFWSLSEFIPRRSTSRGIKMDGPHTNLINSPPPPPATFCMTIINLRCLWVMCPCKAVMFVWLDSFLLHEHVPTNTSKLVSNYCKTLGIITTMYKTTALLQLFNFASIRFQRFNEMTKNNSETISVSHYVQLLTIDAVRSCSSSHSMFSGDM